MSLSPVRHLSLLDPRAPHYFTLFISLRSSEKDASAEKRAVSLCLAVLITAISLLRYNCTPFLTLYNVLEICSSYF